jgi:uncharacterized protein Yka (UPF0111/DUF47 family)
VDVAFPLAVAAVLAFAFTNGFNDAANAIATLVATRGARPGSAIVLAAVCNMVGPLLLGAAVANTIASISEVEPAQTAVVVGAALTAAVAWNVTTWRLGLPSSSSHALVGGLVGATVVEAGAGAGAGAVNWGGDDAKKELRRLLTVAFTTPIDAEDIYVMSERLDAVLNGAKDTVREAEVMGIAPDEAVAAMAELLADGVKRLTGAFSQLGRNRHGDGAATAAADAAVKTQRQLERVYRKAASALLTVDDLREVIGRRELYRRFSRVSETLIEAADRVWYATVKEG